MARFKTTPVLLDCARPVLGNPIQLGCLVPGDVDHGHAALHHWGEDQPIATGMQSCRRNGTAATNPYL
jgi:hypothetical protein